MKLSKELIDAAGDGDIERIERLAAEGHDLNLVDEENGEDLLYHFVFGCYEPDKLQRLIQVGCRPSNKPCKGGTPLIAAVWSKSPEIVKILLDAGADPNVKGFLGEGDSTPLDIVILDLYCDCDTEEEKQALEKIEAMIRACGGRRATPAA